MDVVQAPALFKFLIFVLVAVILGVGFAYIGMQLS